MLSCDTKVTSAYFLIENGWVMQVTSVLGEVAQLLGIGGRCSMKLPRNLRIYLSSETYSFTGSNDRTRNRSSRSLCYLYKKKQKKAILYKNSIT